MGLLPDPEPQARHHVIISVDDHIIEPPDMFEGRLPAALQDRAPRVVEKPDGSQTWVYEDREYPNVGLNAVIGRPKDEWSMEPARFDEMRKGCWDVDARIRDMDLAGIWASMNFPSLIAGFAGTVFWKSQDPELGIATLRAWNDYHLEVWAAAYPERIIPLQIPWLADVELAAEEVRRNAARGFKAVSFPELPAHSGIGSIHPRTWDPFFAACEETDTVLCLHTGSAQWAPFPSPDMPFEAITTLFPAHALIAAADWLWSQVPVRFPKLNIMLAEGGVGWAGMLADRADFVLAHSASGSEGGSWKSDLLPSEVLKRNFWFCSIDDPTALANVSAFVDHILVESDYPHADSTWPDTQALVAANLKHLSPEDIAKVTHLNAAKLFRHPLPDAAWLSA